MEDILKNDNSKSRKRVGRGNSAGGGSTAGRGNKGQKARTGGSVPAHFEGGQTPLIRRLKKKKGFKSHRKFTVLKINLRDLAHYAQDNKLTLTQLLEKGLITPHTRVKILGEGEVPAGMEVTVNGISEGARKKIESAGGKVEINKY